MWGIGELLKYLDSLAALRALILVQRHDWTNSRSAGAIPLAGRRLHQGYDSQAALRAALAQAPWETLEFQLSPAARES